MAATAEELNELRTRIGDAETNSQRLQRIEDKRVGELMKRLSEQEVGSLSSSLVEADGLPTKQAYAVWCCSVKPRQSRGNRTGSCR